MSTERMTDTSWCHYQQDEHWTQHDRKNITAELNRARTEEARLLEENRKQAETIQALVDALVLARKGLVQSGELEDVEWRQIEAALRLAWRLP